jgi:DNA-binding LacI/PurR family transcriptional regulator
MAVGVAQAARELGLEIPDQLSIVGFDDMPLASYFHPPLTTMRQDLQVIGREAARLLIQCVENPTVSHRHLAISANLVRRDSTSRISSI